MSNRCCDVDEVAVELASSGWKHKLNHCETRDVVEALYLKGMLSEEIRRQTGLSERKVTEAREELVTAGILRFHGGRLVRDLVDAW